jgi:hypothetical protein
MARWARRPLLGLALLALVTTGCANKVYGTPTAVNVPEKTRDFDDPDRLTAEDALGDLTRFNPCSVVDPDEMPDDWTARVDVPVAFEYCAMAVTTQDGATAEVQVGYLYESEQKGGDGDRKGGLSVVPTEDTDTACTRDIVFADGIALEVRSWAEDPADAKAMCGIADGAVDHIVDAIVAGKAESLSLPEHSVGQIDPCDVVTPDMAAVVRGVTAAVRPERQTAGHTCWWQAEEGTMLEVAFDIGRIPVGDTGETVHDRYTATTQYADSAESSTCAVVGEHVPFEYDSTTGLMERAAVWVYLKPGEVEAACAAAKQVADKLWPALPKL